MVTTGPSGLILILIPLLWNDGLDGQIDRQDKQAEKHIQNEKLPEVHGKVVFLCVEQPKKNPKNRRHLADIIQNHV